MQQVRLGQYRNQKYDPGRGVLVRFCWYLLNAVFMQSYLFPFSALKRGLLRLFGAVIGQGVIIKPNVNVKYPWYLVVGDHTWIGEGVWIDNLVEVKIGANVCLSQGAFLLTGNHNYKKAGFDLITQPIVLEEGVWLGAKSMVCPGVICHSHAVLSAASVATKDLEPYSVYQGHPAVKIRDRVIKA